MKQGSSWITYDSVHNIFDPEKTGDYIRNIRVISPGGICDNDPYLYALNGSEGNNSFTPFEDIYETQKFHPLFLRDIRKFRTIRFMDYFLTSDVKYLPENWNDRSKMNDYTWGSSKGGPNELAIEMSNMVNAEPWLNIPTRANDDYVYQYAQLVKTHLAPELDVYIELGNEIWNTAYPFAVDGNWKDVFADESDRVKCVMGGV